MKTQEKTKTLHQQLLKEIIRHSGKPTQHTFSDNYLGNQHPRYAVSIPQLRALANVWMKENAGLTPPEFVALLTSLINAPSSTEKTMVGILLDYASREQRSFNPKILNAWLDQLEGWAEVDSLCTSGLSVTQIIADWDRWKKLLFQLNKSKNINKRRASIVLLCQPLRQNDSRIPATAFELINNLKHEKEILITKAISWVLRSMEKFHRDALEEYLHENKETLPAIAVRETWKKLKTGKKTARK
jgi:3-methyladenine DNA glycosylase AlkD